MTALTDEDITEPVEQNQAQDKPEEQKKESDEDKNWKAFLEKRKEEAKEFEVEKEKVRQLEADKARWEKEKEIMKEAFVAAVEKKDSAPFPDEDDEEDRKFNERFEKKYQERESERVKREHQNKLEREIIEIKNEMPDLQEVCSQENIAYLEYYHKPTAKALAAMPDGIEKTKLAYQAIKQYVKMGTKEKEKIEQNLSKPKSVHSNFSNETQKEESSGHLSDKRRNEVYQKMQRLISGEDED